VLGECVQMRSILPTMEDVYYHSKEFRERSDIVR
jgi:hypothetical protein